MGNIYTKAQAKATKKYYSKFSRMTLRLLPALKDEISASSEEQGESINTFCINAIKMRIEECNEKKMKN